MLESRIRPFSQIPQGNFPGEARPAFPNPDTTIFRHPSFLLEAIQQKKLIFDFNSTDAGKQIESAVLFSNWLLAGKSDARRQAKDKLTRYIQTDFPQNYETLLSVINTQGGNMNDSYNYRELAESLGIIEHFDQQPHIGMLFWKHAVDSQEEEDLYRTNLENLLRSTYSKDADNYFFLEKGDKGSEGFEEAYKKYESFTTARIYVGIMNRKREAGDSKPVTEEDMIQWKLWAATEQRPDVRHTRIQFDTLDKLAAEGYNIIPVVEDQQDDADEVVDSFNGGFGNNVRKWKAWFEQIADNTIRRNQKSALRITQAITRSIASGHAANLAGEMGTAHGSGPKSIPNYLPEILRPFVISISGDLEGEILEPLMRAISGENISDEQMAEYLARNKRSKRLLP
ncbi:MAG TPA: hypothetical protein VLE91_00575 [Candidatus Saccharimonadales bacterium]|nr:hypothetical protein [Candidatus Saccharimonadales bacterium]